MEKERKSFLMNLPGELILKILSYSDIHTKTLLNFGETCKKFHNLVKDPILWKKRLQSRYRNIYEAILLCGTDDYIDQYRYVENLESTLLMQLKGMSPRPYMRSREFGINDVFQCFLLCNDRNISLMCVHHLLVDIINKSGQVIESDYPSTSYYNLTVQYYATHVIRFIMHVFLMLTWRSMKLVLEEIVMERVLTFYGNWINCLQFTDYKDVKIMLDDLADEAIRSLPHNHPIHAIPPEGREAWTDKLLVDNLWDWEHNRAVHHALKDLLYKKRELKMAAKISFDNIHIPQMLKRKRGHMISLAILYESLARRCGLRCNVVSFTDHFFLEWKESYTLKSPEFRINLTNGELEKKRVCPFAVAGSMSREYAPENVIDCLTEQFRIVLDNERNTTLILKVEALDEIIHGGVNHDGRYLAKYEALEIMNDLTHLLIERPDACLNSVDQDYRALMVEFASPSSVMLSEFAREKRIVYRNHGSSNVHFAVGMVCKHRLYNYTCVVTGWDPLCAAPLEWQTRMGVSRLEFKQHQPFYNVYATDGTTRYVAQENLKIVIGYRPRIIEDVIGKEFSHFNGTFYIPNQEKQEEYPDEHRVIAAYRRAPTLLMSTCKLTKPVPGHMQYFNWR